MSTPIARITSDKKLNLKGNLFTQVDAYDDTTTFDDTYQFDDTTTFDDNAEITTLLNYLLGITNTTTKADSINFDYKGNLIVPEVYTVWPSFDTTQNVDTTYQIDDTHSVDTSAGIEEFFGYLFGVAPQDIPIDKFSITSDKKLLCNEVLENQIL